jgi:hypothetical protein
VGAERHRRGNRPSIPTPPPKLKSSAKLVSVHFPQPQAARAFVLRPARAKIQAEISRFQ